MAGHVLDNGASPDTPARSPKWWQRVGRMELNAIALMAATGISALLGLAFWAVAAHNPPDEVGRTAGIINTAMLLSQMASANIGILFGRILAGAGGKARRVVLAGYGIASALGAALGLVFLLLYSAGAATFLTEDKRLFVLPGEEALFPLLVVVFGIFSLQDWVLIGVRGSAWVPVEQLLFSVAKLGLLVWFTAEAVTSGIVWSWAIPCLATVLVINPILLLRVLPRMRVGEGAMPMPQRRELVKAFLAEYATGTVTVVIPLTLPLLVIAMLGREANAYYQIPWTIAEALGLLIWNISSSYVVEASHDNREQAGLMRRSLRLSFLICLLGVPFLVIAGPWLLAFLGSGYVSEGASVLRLLVLAIPFSVINTTWMNTARVRNQMGRVVALEIMLGVIVVGLAIILLPRMGPDGSALAFLAGQVVAAFITTPSVIRTLRSGSGPAVPAGEPSPVVAPTMPIPVVKQPVVAPHDPTRPMPAVTRGRTP